MSFARWGPRKPIFSHVVVSCGVFKNGQRAGRVRASEATGAARISANESENSPAARVATIFMGLLARASDSRSREFASLGAQGPNES